MVLNQINNLTDTISPGQMSEMLNKNSIIEDVVERNIPTAPPLCHNLILR
jgi:hypothetical protein